jgi:hypothetical protein
MLTAAKHQGRIVTKGNIGFLKSNMFSYRIYTAAGGQVR